MRRTDMTSMHSIETSGPAGTHRAGELLAGLVRPGDVIALGGGLGAGKTALVQGLAAGMGVVGHVPSPTFNLLLVHRADVPLYHFDLYRLETASQLVDIDFYETLEAGGVSAIEWADRFPEQLPDDRLDVTIEVTGEESRRLDVEGTGPRSRDLARSWSDAWRDAGGGEGR